MKAISSNTCYSALPRARPNRWRQKVSRRFGLPLIALATALIANFSPATAQTHSGGNWSGRTYNNPMQSANPFNGNQPQQDYPSDAYHQQQGYTNGYQGRRLSQGNGLYSYPRGNSYTAPGYTSYGIRSGGWYEQRPWRERMWRERMWHER